MADAAVSTSAGPTAGNARLAAEAVPADVLVERVSMFGSVARGEASRQSDIDVMVVVADSYGPDGLSRLDGFAWRVGV